MQQVEIVRYNDTKTSIRNALSKLLGYFVDFILYIAVAILEFLSGRTAVNKMPKTCSAYNLHFQKKMLRKECGALENMLLGRDSTFRLLSVAERCERADLLEQYEYELPKLLIDHLLMIAPVGISGNVVVSAYTTEEIDAEIARIGTVKNGRPIRVNLSPDECRMLFRRQNLVKTFAKLYTKKQEGQVEAVSFGNIKSEFHQEIKRGRCQKYRHVLRLIDLFPSQYYGA